MCWSTAFRELYLPDLQVKNGFFEQSTSKQGERLELQSGQLLPMTGASALV
jgi:hypothetical protein